jgi:chitodextrinase
VTGTSFTDSGLERGTTYHYEIVARDATGNSSPPALLAAGTLGFSDWLAARGLAGQTAGDSDRGGLDNLAEYELEMDPADPLDDPTFRLTCIHSGPLVRVRYPTLKPTGNYHLHSSRDLSDIRDPSKRVHSISRSQIGAMSPQQRGSQFVDFPAADRGFFILVFELSADGVAPTAPAALDATPDYRSVALSWTAATDDQAVASYQIRRDGKLVGSVTGLSFSDTGLLPGRNHSYQVIALDSSGNPSPPAAASTTTRSFDDWLAEHDLAGRTDADSDRGGLDNASEFHFDLDPRDPLDDLSFRLRLEPGPTSVKVHFPKLVPTGDYHLHRSAGLDGLNHPASRILTLSRAAIDAMGAGQRDAYSIDVPRLPGRGFFTLHFEPATE